MLAPGRANRLGAGIVLFALGVFFQLERLDWISFSLTQAWPALLIAAGIGLIAESLLARRADRSELSATSSAGPREMP
jgi:hypothetical protein